MNLSAIYKIFFLISFLLIGGLCYAQSNIKVCLTGRVVENFQAYGQSFLNAAFLSKDQVQLHRQVEIKKYFYDNKPLEPIRMYEKMINEGCSAIIGFEYLSDLLLVLRSQTSEDIPIFTSYATSTINDTLPKNIFIFMPTYNFMASKMLDYLHHHFGEIKNALLITEISREEMLKYKQVYCNSSANYIFLN